MVERAVYKACYRLVSTGDTFGGGERYISLSFLRLIIVHREMLIQTRVNKFVWLFSLPPRKDSARPQTTATPGLPCCPSSSRSCGLAPRFPPAGPRNINLHVLSFPPGELA